MPTILIDIEFLEHLPSRMESLVYTVEQRLLPGVREQVALLETDECSSFRQRFDADYQQWRQITDTMLRTGKDLSQRLHQVICGVEHIEWDTSSISAPGEMAPRTTRQLMHSEQEGRDRCV